MKIAVEGCCHGELDMIYDTLNHISAKDKIKIDLLICCGDFQAVRNPSDLKSMAVPPKYQKLNTFYKYYNGEKQAPILTIFIGGNHEASNYLQELPYGGWVAPNIYYLGYANVVRFGGLRICGISGIYKSHDYLKGHYEFPPYTDKTKRSIYHVRNLEIFRMKQITEQPDIFISHDWPCGIYDYGNKGQLMKKKPFLREEITKGTLGNPPLMEVLHAVKPKHWFAAHMHVKFAARVQHTEEKETKFLSLDKCLPKRQFLQILDIEHDESKDLQLELDPEWLSILKKTDHFLSTSPYNNFLPNGDNPKFNIDVTTEDLSNLSEDFNGNFTIPKNFSPTAPIYTPNCHKNNSESIFNINPQTSIICTMLGITDPNCKLMGKTSPDSTGNESLNDSYLESKISDSDDDNSHSSNVSKSKKKAVNKLFKDHPNISPENEEKRKNIKRNSNGLTSPLSNIDLSLENSSLYESSTSFYEKFYSLSNKSSNLSNGNNDISNHSERSNSTNNCSTPFVSFENGSYQEIFPQSEKSDFDVALSPITKKHTDADSPFLNPCKDQFSNKHIQKSFIRKNINLAHFKSSTPFSKCNSDLIEKGDQLPLPSMFRNNQSIIYDTPSYPNDCTDSSSVNNLNSPKAKKLVRRNRSIYSGSED